MDGPSHHCNAHPQVIASKALASALSQWPEICSVVGYGWLNLGPSINPMVDLALRGFQSLNRKIF